jgi:putative peptidoglycan binding protein
MNPELEARLRRLGARVDAAADEAATRHRVVPLHKATGEQATIVPKLEPVVATRGRPARFYRVLAVSAAAAAVAIALGVVIGRSAEEGAERPFASGTELAAVATSEPEPESTEEPIRSPSTTMTRPATPTSTTPRSSPTTTASTPTTSSTTLPESTDEANTTAPRACPSYRVNDSLPLRLCDRGEMVRQVQQRLAETVAPELLVDGFFGPSTQAAVLAFQQQNPGLEVDGLVGPATMTALFAGATASAEV